MENVSSIFDGKLDILINNAAAPFYKAVVDYTVYQLRVAFHLCLLAYPLLKASGNGNFVNIPSIARIQSRELLAVYAASKGAMNQLKRNLAFEWAGDNIRTNCVAPGYIKTQMAQSVIAVGLAIGVGLHAISHLTCDFPRLFHCSDEEYISMKPLFGGLLRVQKDGPASLLLF